MRRHLIELKAPFPDEIKDLLRRVGSRKKSCLIYEDTCEPRVIHSYWSGGTRDEYYVVRKGEFVHIPIGNGGWGPEPPPYEPEVGDIMVEIGTFCGKQATPKITMFRKREDMYGTPRYAPVDDSDFAFKDGKIAKHPISDGEEDA